MEWNILFLVPLPWIGPVVAPIIVSPCLITAALLLLLSGKKGKLVILSQWDWTLEILVGVRSGSVLLDHESSSILHSIRLPHLMRQNRIGNTE